MISPYPKLTLLMLAIGGAVPTAGAEAFLLTNDASGSPQHQIEDEVEKWAEAVVPIAAEADGEDMLRSDRDAFFALYAPSEDVSIPNLLGWADIHAARPAINFTVGSRSMAPKVSHIPFTRSWIVVLPGVLNEQSGNSKDEASARACARIYFHDGRFRLEHLDFKLG